MKGFVFNFWYSALYIYSKYIEPAFENVMNISVVKRLHDTMDTVRGGHTAILSVDHVNFTSIKKTRVYTASYAHLVVSTCLAYLKLDRMFQSYMFKPRLTASVPSSENALLIKTWAGEVCLLRHPQDTFESHHAVRPLQMKLLSATINQHDVTHFMNKYMQAFSKKNKIMMHELFILMYLEDYVTITMLCHFLVLVACCQLHVIRSSNLESQAFKDTDIIWFHE